jgi:hypothetical protein
VNTDVVLVVLMTDDYDERPGRTEQKLKKRERFCLHVHTCSERHAFHFPAVVCDAYLSIIIANSC